MDQSATSTTVTGPVGERLQAGTHDAPVLDRPEPLRRFHDSGAGYKYPDLLTYLTSYSSFIVTTGCFKKVAPPLQLFGIFHIGYVFLHEILQICWQFISTII